MSELLDQVPHITLVDLIHSALDVRAPEALSAAMDVIYFLEPSEESLVVALDDHHHDGMPPAYGGAVHFVFTRRLPDELLELIRSSPVLARVATLRELNLQFHVKATHGQICQNAGVGTFCQAAEQPMHPQGFVRSVGIDCNGAVSGVRGSGHMT